MEDAVEIAAPREVVWGAFADLSCWADWNSVLTRAAPADGGAELAAGGRFFCAVRPYWLPVRFAARVEEAVPPGRLLWTVRRLGVHSHHWFHLRESEGGTVLESVEELTGPLVTLAGPFFPLGRLRRLGRRFLEDLKAEAERRASARG
jgi:uncharacterized protein YndB with AHSA1/START domain